MNQRSPTQTKTQELSFTPVPTNLLQRKCASCGQYKIAGGGCSECSKKQLLQRYSKGKTQLAEVPSIVHEVLNSPGQPLDSGIRTFIESRFGQDFSGVRAHTNAKAATSAQAVNALAYTVGDNVVFNTGQYAPQTQVGKQLIAHELTHVMQQRTASSSAIATKASATQTTDLAEQEADTVSQQVMLGSNVNSFTHPSPVTIQKQEPNQPKDEEQIVLSSGLKVSKQLFSNMLVMCSQGKLDPVRCFELRKELQRMPGQPIVPTLGQIPLMVPTSSASTIKKQVTQPSPLIITPKEVNQAASLEAAKKSATISTTAPESKKEAESPKVSIAHSGLEYGGNLFSPPDKRKREATFKVVDFKLTVPLTPITFKWISGDFFKELETSASFQVSHEQQGQEEPEPLSSQLVFGASLKAASWDWEKVKVPFGVLDFGLGVTGKYEADLRKPGYALGAEVQSELKYRDSETSRLFLSIEGSVGFKSERSAEDGGIKTEFSPFIWSVGVGLGAEFDLPTK
jgi:hypothetical protein